MRWVRNVAAAAAVSVLFFVVTSRTVAQDRDAKPSVKTLPPVVVRTMPQSGDTKVDAAKVKEIRVTFSKEMMGKSWSWTQISDDTALPITGEIRYQKNKRTCVAPVKLEPGRTYVSWLNSAKFGNFRDADGRSAVPYLLVFETKPAGP
ncbi:MAG: Ig-like domain-containing protein [Phycisphaerae bacterium]